MFKKHLLIAFFAALSFMVISCPEDNEWIDYVPPVIGIQFTVANNFNEPVQIDIRHSYGMVGQRHRRYSDWSEAVTIQPGGSQSIGNETASFTYRGKSETMTGFILWDKSFDDVTRSYDQSLSFEARVQFSNTTHYLAGFETENCRFAAERFGEMITANYTVSRDASFYFRTKAHPLRSPILIPATLTINADGTYAIAYDNAALQSAKQYQ